MSEKNMSENILLAPYEILFTAGSKDRDLFFVRKGKVMVFVQNGSQITPVAYIGEQQFIGELSFFDYTKRSASIIAIEDTEVVKISSNELYKYIPKWLQQVGLKISQKIRINDEVIRSRGIRKTNVESIKPLPMEEQRKIYMKVEEYKTKK
jgi:CRP-like cAMP-binding protein